MKSYLPVVGVLIAVINLFLLLPGSAGFTVPLAIVALLLAAAVVYLSLRLRPSAGEQPSLAAPEAVVSVPRVAAPPAPPNQAAEAEIVGFLALLQEKGRFIDFVMEDVTSAEDAQLGAAARIVHQGCRQVMQENFQVVPITAAAEGTDISIPAEHAADEFRIIGKISGNPPFQGKLLHKGWRTESVKLPRLIHSSVRPLPVIAPAEVELS